MLLQLLVLVSVLVMLPAVMIIVVAINLLDCLAAYLMVTIYLVFSNFFNHDWLVAIICNVDISVVDDKLVLVLLVRILLVYAVLVLSFADLVHVRLCR